MTDRPIKWPFWLELMLTAVIPFVVWWSLTPTNVLNSSNLCKLLETVGLAGSILVFWTGIPVGIIGIRVAKKMEKLRIVTKVLSIINLSAGIIEVGMLVLVFCISVFGGVHH